MTRLRISPDLSLPADTVTSTGLVLGGKGMGKSTLARVLAEELAKHRLRFSAIDPMDVWWGLRHSANGKGPGIEVLILGGRHGDLPITSTSGQIVADLVVDERANVIIVPAEKSGEPWSKGEKIRFVTAYMTQLCRRLGRTREPLLQIIDEAGRWIPQTIPAGAPDLALCVGAIEQAVEEGRNYGLGVWMITQRSARINKSVAELADTMIAFRTIGPRSMAAILDWFGDNVPRERWDRLTARIRELDVGTALVVSPGWLKFEGEIRVRPGETFDSSATPKAGARRRAPKRGADIDVKKYEQRMAATVAEAEANDVKKLRQRATFLEVKNRELEHKLASAQNIRAALAAQPKVVTRATKTEVVRTPVITNGQLQRLERAAATFERASGQVTDAVYEVRERVKNAQREFERRPNPPTRAAAGPVPPATRPASRVELTRTGGDSDAGLPLKAGARRMVRALADWGRPLTKTQLATLAQITPSSGTFYKYLRSLERGGLAAVDLENVSLTAEGHASFPALGDSPRTEREIADAFAARLKKGARLMLDALLNRRRCDKQTLAQVASITPGSGTFYKYLRSLIRNGLAEERDGYVELSSVFHLDST